MATGGLYGSSPTGATVAAPGSESAGLYGNGTTFGGSYFEWFIFIQSATQPATPTGGSWSFTTNSGTPPAGWSAFPPSAPTLPVWVSIALVNSKNTTALTWSAPGLFAYASGLPILSGSSEPTSGLGLTDQLYIQTSTTPQTIWFKQAGTWTRLTGSTLYVDLTTNQTIAGTKTFSSQIQGSVSGTAANVTGIVDITNGGTGSSTASGARTALGVTATGQDTTYAYRANNLSDLASASTARTNLGLGSAAVLTAGAANGVATLDAGGTVPLSQIPASIQGGVSYQGAWNASTNSPTLTSSVGTKGYYYVVSTAGSTNLNGVTDWNIGDWAIFNGSIWQKIDNTDAVTSVNGFTGTVVLNAADVGAISGITSTDGSVTITSSGTSRDLSVATAAAATNVICQVRNATGATVTKGTVVYISGATGQIPTISKALATSDATSAQTLGMMTADLANNSNGYVTIIGLISNIDTSAYTDGAQLYLSGTTAGAVTATKPYAPIHLVYVAVVEYAHPTQGKLFVKVQNGYELDEIHNVSAQTPSNGQTIVYNSSTGLWTQNTISLTLGVNGVLPTANGGTNLSSFTSGGVVYASSTSALATGSGLTFNGTDTLTVANLVGTRYGLYSEGAGVLFGGNATTNYLRFTVANAEQMRLTTTGLGIGTSAPAAKFEVSASFADSAIEEIARISRTGGTTGYATNRAGALTFFDTPNSTLTGAIAGVRDIAVGNFRGSLAFYTTNAGAQATSVSSLLERLRINSDGNVGIGQTSPTRKLELLGSGAVFESITTLDANQVGLLFGISGTANQANITYSATGLQVSTGTALPIIFNTNGSERSRIDSTGNFFIATTTNTNTSKLVVNGTISQTVGGTQYLVVDQSDIGTAANEIPLNQYLGNLAYEDNTNLPSVGVGAGTAALPSIFNATDNDTGFWFPAANTLAASVNGAEQIRLNATGLAIGTTTPLSGAKLTVVGGGVHAQAIVATGSADSFGDGGGLMLEYLSGVGSIRAYSDTGGTGSTAIRFLTAGTERMRLDASGNLGIGTSSVTNARLKVSSSTASGAIMSEDTAGTTSFVRILGDFSSQNLINWQDGTALRFATSTQAYGSFAERARIDSSGNLLVGTTTSGVGNTGGTGIGYNGGASYQSIGHINGTASGSVYVSFGYNGGAIANITQSGTTAVLYNVTSDQRLKENIVDAPDFGSVIDSIKVRSFDWITDQTHQRAGFIAQELVTVAPEAVHQPTNTEEMMAVDYSKLVPMLVKEVQSLRARVAQLEG